MIGAHNHICIMIVYHRFLGEIDDRNMSSNLFNLDNSII